MTVEHGNDAPGHEGPSGQDGESRPQPQAGGAAAHARALARAREAQQHALKGTGLSLQARALRALAGREYSRAELRRKLVLHVQAEGDDATGAAAERPGPDTPDALEALLDKLQARGLLSDERAAEALVRQKAPRMGSVRLRQALQAKGLDKELVQEALAPLQETELERARQVWQAKFGGVDLAALPWPEQQKMRAKQMRFLLTRGFAMDVVRQLLP